jgi:hypothetical protein
MKKPEVENLVALSCKTLALTMVLAVRCLRIFVQSIFPRLELLCHNYLCRSVDFISLLMYDIQ